jgi:uncharacterized protein YaaR (DUF327 family)
MKYELHLLIENLDSELLELVYSILRKNENELDLIEAQFAEFEGYMNLILKILRRVQVGMR